MNRARISVENWGRVFREHGSSGQSVAAFCRQAGLSQASFYFWRRKLQAEPTPSKGSGSRRGGMKLDRRSRGPASSRTTGFVEVRLPSEALADARAIELRLPGGRCLVIRPGFDRSTLVDLLATLESCDADPRNAPSAELDGGRRWPRREARR